MGTDSTDPTHTPGIASNADTDAPHPQVPEGPDASGTHSVPKVSSSSPRGEDGSDPHRRLVVVYSEVGKAVVGQETAVTGLVIALPTGGYVLLEGVPSTAKILLVRPLVTMLNSETKRIQFTPDLMPGDITGLLIYDPRSAQFSFRTGLASINLLLTDKTNRTPPKTQPALLGAMGEHQVFTDGEPRVLPDPFMAIATQDLVEYEGTYPLPEAQLDRFLFKLVLPLSEQAQKIEVFSRHTSEFDSHDLLSVGLWAVVGVQELAQARAQVSTVGVTSEVLAYAVDPMHATRSAPSVALGVSPRGTTALLVASRTRAWLAGRSFVTPDDTKVLTLPALRYRIKLRTETGMKGITSQSVIEAVL